MKENREVKSDVFSMLMENKKYALEVYNALNGSDYEDEKLVEFKTLEKGISLTIRNDAAFIIDMNLNIYEHQSTYNPNMPLRSLIYIAEIIKGIVKNRDLYGRNKVLIPTPKFVIFYNGREDRQPKEVIRLSDLYQKPTDNPELELTCTIYNINPGKFRSLLDNCSVLDEYTAFIEKIREYEADEIEAPIESAIEWCIENHILEDFLRTKKSEVLKAMTIDMTFEHREEIIRREVAEEAMAKGKAEGKAEDIIELLEEFGTVPEELVARIMGEKDLPTLTKWHKTAIRCSSVDEFTELIG